MIYASLLLGQLGLLYLLSNQLDRQLSRFFIWLTKSPQVTIWLLALLFCPGTLIHELAHLLTARLLLVSAGGLTLRPKLQNGGVTMGSVLVPRTDHIRMFLISLAPGLVGISLIIALLWWGPSLNSSWWWIAFLGYAVFQIGNTMFASDADLHGAVGLIVLLGLWFGFLYVLGEDVSLDWLGPWLDQHWTVFHQAVQLLWIPLVIDLIVLSILWPVNRVLLR